MSELKTATFYREKAGRLKMPAEAFIDGEIPAGRLRQACSTTSTRRPAS